MTKIFEKKQENKREIFYRSSKIKRLKIKKKIKNMIIREFIYLFIIIIITLRVPKVGILLREGTPDTKPRNFASLAPPQNKVKYPSTRTYTYLPSSKIEKFQL